VASVRCGVGVDQESSLTVSITLSLVCAGARDRPRSGGLTLRGVIGGMVLLGIAQLVAVPTYSPVTTGAARKFRIPSVG
jgi:hypothetical protein